MKPIHQSLNLYIDGDEAYTFIPTGSAGAHSLTIQRATGEIYLDQPNTTIPSSAQRYHKAIYGIIGVISLSLSDYVVVATGRELRGHLMGHEVYRATDFDVLPLNPNISVINPPHPVESHLIALVRSHWHGGHFLFSYEWDITRRLQAQWFSREEDATKAIWETADNRFFWNRYMQTRLIDASTAKQDLSPFILPVMYGTFDIRSVFLNGRHFQICLISRRSRFRAGTRYFRRGIDQDGHVANFNETEQLLLVEGPPSATRTPDEYAYKLSFVQIRGSIPMYWAEVNTLRYKPDLQIMDLQDTLDVMRLHLQEQVALYGEQALVNLINQKGHEKPVKEAYERYLSELNLPKVKYEYFDFHTECKHMRWDRISVLIERLQEDLDRQGYFYLADSKPIKVQEGIVRTNCMDNLDRTNVVQATLAKWVLTQQLRTLGIIQESESVDDYETLSKDFREMWADHADLISKAYGGSGALKSDFTRTNKRTKKGLMEDGVKSVLRYLKNNMFDGPRQDGFDLVTGAWIPRKNPSLALHLITDSRPLVTRSMPVVAYFALFMICAGLTLPRTSDYNLAYYFIIWISVLSAALIFIVLYGIDYVSWPRLLPPTDIIWYSGPGYRSADNGKGVKGWPIRVKHGDKVSARGRGSLNGGEQIEMGTMRKRVD
ncbi:hypothetical protein EYR40_004309 [Pleurotus pulmonarius]|nr:hypothetical protein EYR40_004309 [Pleurotus pulmonarius]KAF4607011.1 hypothetical protein EYR38_001068 [Pleurotus pulmonarius]